MYLPQVPSQNGKQKGSGKESLSSSPLATELIQPLSDSWPPMLCIGPTVHHFRALIRMTGYACFQLNQCVESWGTEDVSETHPPGHCEVLWHNLLDVGWTSGCSKEMWEETSYDSDEWHKSDEFRLPDSCLRHQLPANLWPRSVRNYHHPTA